MALWELPGSGEDMGVFWWFHHQNTPYILSATEIPKDPHLISLRNYVANLRKRVPEVL